MSQLVSISRAKEIDSLSTATDAQLSSLIEACSAVCEGYCSRKFDQQSFDELYHGTGGRSLHLNNYPVASVSSVRTGRAFALYVQNTSTTNQAATVQVTSSAVVLSRSASGTTTTNTLTFASYADLSSMTTAINALGNGWSASSPASYSTWATADLHPQGAFSARNVTANISIYYWYLSGWQWKAETGELWMEAGFARGYQTVRVQYTAGYDPIPEDLQQAVCELIQHTWYAGRINPALVSESLGGYSYTRAATRGLEDLSWAGKQTLMRYRRLPVSYWSA